MILIVFYVYLLILFWSVVCLLALFMLSFGYQGHTKSDYFFFFCFLEQFEFKMLMTTYHIWIYFYYCFNMFNNLSLFRVETKLCFSFPGWGEYFPVLFSKPGKPCGPDAQFYFSDGPRSRVRRLSLLSPYFHSTVLGHHSPSSRSYPWLELPNLLMTPESLTSFLQV